MLFHCAPHCTGLTETGEPGDAAFSKIKALAYDPAATTLYAGVSTLPLVLQHLIDTYLEGGLPAGLSLGSVHMFCKQNKLSTACLLTPHRACST